MVSIKSICTFVCIVSAQFIFAQCMQVEVPIDYVPTRSDLIIEGEVSNIEVTWNESTTKIQTVYTVNIYKIIKGNTESDKVSIIAQGGKIGEVWHQVFPEVSFSKGNIGVFLLNRLQDSPLGSVSYKAWAMDQSTYIYERETGETTDGFKTYDLNKKLITDRLAAICKTNIQEVRQFDLATWLDSSDEDQRSSSTIMSFSPTTIRAGINDILTINGTNFGSAIGNVGFREADSTNPNDFTFNPSSHVISWSDTQIRVRVASRAGTGRVRVFPSSGPSQTSSSDLTITYNIASFNNSPADFFVRYVSTTSAGNIDYQHNTNFASNTAAAESFERAMTTWKCSTGINWTYDGNTTVNNTSSDGISVIRWSNGEITYPTIGQYNGYFFASGGNTEWCAREFDIMFLPNDSDLTWHYGAGNPPSGSTDFESTALHELGHALILGHISDSDAVMYPSSSAGTTNREPTTGDLNGALFSVPKHQSFPSSCSSSFALTPAAGAVVTNTNTSGAGTLQQALLDACDGGTVTFDASLTGSIINLGGTPLTIGKNTTLIGLGASQFTLSGNNQNRIFTIENDIVFNLSDIRLINAQEATNGGAFYNQGETTLKDVILEGNKEGNTDKAFSSEPGKTVKVRGQVEVKE